ncbi:GINS complex subunit [Friedmanniomyces endolithicus]|uniref:DNA replication complex GINS protein SLD5 n=1 Tax=Friedmanniomyces endolithicus TaxID=329885 RepID=A0AAN6QMI3_9PEZI|nr:GINS complex subunit [Friedmanniomyces endolithicus]KAK0808308.1 GINS complex subunit [Friedmanniomyces endolithicus]KAK0817749.1 GINS complex subunit [Friedmanniomyces endolithicus]KAK0853789.1 GINS complex subunit [Friedmanniomyces endolithicus]KAK0906464.1 GINS complex subunit [Friedmanniomyces endolithicus]
MDDDIADILASVSAPSISQRTLDLQALTRAWVAERTAPELLPYPTELVERVMERLGKQISNIEDMTGPMDPQANFTLVILQTELERYKFLVRSFLRARIAKIDAFPHHYLTLPETLSPLERQYLASHQALLSNHYSTSFLSAFPKNLQKLDDTAGGISMVDKPDEDTAVFCRVLRDAGKVEIQGPSQVSEAELTRGDVWVMRWSTVREAVRRGDVELI